MCDTPDIAYIVNLLTQIMTIRRLNLWRIVHFWSLLPWSRTTLIEDGTKIAENTIKKSRRLLARSEKKMWPMPRKIMLFTSLFLQETRYDASCAPIPVRRFEKITKLISRPLRPGMSEAEQLRLQWIITTSLCTRTTLSTLSCMQVNCLQSSPQKLSSWHESETHTLVLQNQW